MWSSKNRRRGAQGVLDANQDMPREAMLYACTSNAKRGEAGGGRRFNCKAANFALVNRDVLTVPAAQMRDTSVLCTIVAREWACGANGSAAAH